MSDAIKKKVLVPATSRVTIGLAQSWYEQDDGIVKASAFREVIEQLLKTDIQTEFENDSYFDALVLTEVMFNRSNQSIDLFTGPGCGEFLQTLRKSFIGALERLHNAKGKMRIICVSQVNTEWKKPEFLLEIAKKVGDTLQISNAWATQQISHFIVCDSKMAREEKPHPALSKDTLIDAIQAKVYFNNPVKAQLLEARFNGFWKVCNSTGTAA